MQTIFFIVLAGKYSKMILKFTTHIFTQLDLHMSKLQSYWYTLQHKHQQNLFTEHNKTEFSKSIKNRDEYPNKNKKHYFQKNNFLITSCRMKGDKLVVHLFTKNPCPLCVPVKNLLIKHQESVSNFFS